MELTASSTLVMCVYRLHVFIYPRREGMGWKDGPGTVDKTLALKSEHLYKV